jgi:hypothetical protein
VSLQHQQKAFAVHSLIVVKLARVPACSLPYSDAAPCEMPSYKIRSSHRKTVSSVEPFTLGILARPAFFMFSRFSMRD